MREITEPANKVADTIIEGVRNGAAKGGNKNFNPDYTLTRPKRLRKFEKVDGVKVTAATWQEPEKIERPQLIRATTAKGRRIEARRNAVTAAARKAAK